MHSTEPAAAGFFECRRPMTKATRHTAMTPAPRYQYAIRTTSSVWALTSIVTAARTASTMPVTAECKNVLRVTWPPTEKSRGRPVGPDRGRDQTDGPTDHQVQSGSPGKEGRKRRHGFGEQSSPLLDGYRFGQVARAVHVEPAQTCNLVSEQLKRKNGEHRLEQRLRTRHEDHVVGVVLDGLVADGRDGDHLRAARPHLLDVRDEL